MTRQALHNWCKLERWRGPPRTDLVQIENKSSKMEAILHLFSSIFFSKKISFQDLIQNQGLKHVAEKIFGYLDAKSLANCREVSKSWRDLIDDGKMWWILQLQEMMTKEHHRQDVQDSFIFLDEFPNWKEVLDFFTTKATPEMTGYFCHYMEFYLNQNLCTALGRVFYFDPLALAINYGHIEFVKLTLQCPFDFNVSRNNIDTPIHLASLPGNETFLCVLLEYAAIWKRVDLNKPVNMPAFFIAAEIGNANALALFIRYAKKLGIDFRGATSIGHTFLHIVVDRGHVELVEMLLENAKKLDIDVNAPNLSGHTALHMTCRPQDSFRVDIGELVAEELGQAIGIPPLTLKKKCGFLSNPNLNQNRIKIVEFILSQAEEHGFYLNATDNHGMILLHMACLEGNSDIVSILKKNAAIKGIDFDAVDDFGRSAFDYARMKGNADLIKVMQD